MAAQAFTTTALIATVSEILLAAGFGQVDPSRVGDWPPPGARVFEDPYSVAAVVAYETWADLETNWLNAQAALVELLSTHFRRDDAKAWEAYLVLMTPSVIPQGSRAEALSIRSNTTHTRKLLITGEDVISIDDVEGGLLPLLPLPDDAVDHRRGSALDMLPDLLERRGIRRDAITTVIEAFSEQQPIAERLYELVEGEVPG